jgi:hypothetical protein
VCAATGGLQRSAIFAVVFVSRASINDVSALIVCAAGIRAFANFYSAI